MPRGALTIGPNSGRIAVTGNNFSDSYIGEGKERRKVNDQAASGVTLEGTDDVTITGNVFSGLSGKAVQLKGPRGKNIIFEANTLTQVDSDVR